MAKKETIKTVAEVERLKQLGRNDYNINDVYGIEDAEANIGGNDTDKQVRSFQIGKNEYNGNNPYGPNSLDI